MYTECMSTQIKVAPRLSLPLSEEERREIIELKSHLQIARRPLKAFVLEAIREKVGRERGKRG
jgi:hypothetical protein